MDDPWIRDAKYSRISHYLEFAVRYNIRIRDEIDQREPS